MLRKKPPSRAQALDVAQAALAANGDREAFAALYARWHGRLLRHARRLTGHPEEARDVMQEAAMAIVRNIHRLRAPELFGPWAYTIVRNRAASHINRKTRDRSGAAAFSTEMKQANHPVADEEATDLVDLIGLLSLADREVLLAFYVEGMSVREISVCLAIPEGTVKSRLYAARARLKSAYETINGD